MLMATTAAHMHTDSTHSSLSTSSTISPPPWHLAAVPVATHHHHQHQQVVLFDHRDLAAPSPSSPPQPCNNNHNHHQLRPAAARRPSSTSRRRRPRPSRKLPTTYITADPASFRRMVHQVTGADDLLPPPATQPTHEATTTLCRPAPTRAVAAVGALPTLDTSALLLRNSGSESTRRTTTGPLEVDLVAGGGVGVGLQRAGYGGFPTLESWNDALLY